MSDSDDDDDFYDAVDVPPKPKIRDVSDARPSAARKPIVTTPVIEESVKHKYALSTTQDMTSFEYNMYHKHRGVAIIFNHFEFNESTLEKRTGTDKDVKVLQETLPLLGFESDNIVVENDLTKSEILNYSYKINAKKSSVFEDCDCIAIFILSHGSKGNKIYARDGDYDLFRVIEQYTPNNFKELAAKPKLFFVNACRGENLDVGVQLRPLRQRANNVVTDSVDSVGHQEVFSHPVHADILISMSSHHEHISFRNVEGSWYIQDLCTVIKIFANEKKLDTTEITELLTRTHNLVSLRIIVRCSSA